MVCRLSGAKLSPGPVITIVSVEPLGTNSSEISIKISFSFRKMNAKESAKWQPFCLGLSVLRKCTWNCLPVLPWWPQRWLDRFILSIFAKSMQSYQLKPITHRGRVTHIMRQRFNHYRFGYLNQCWNISNSNLRNKLQWNHKRNSYIFIQENAFENVCEMAAILSQPHCDNDISLT